MDTEYIRAFFTTSGSAVCFRLHNPVYGTWFAAAYLAEDGGDEPIVVSLLLQFFAGIESI